MRGVIPILVTLCVVRAVPFLFRQPEIDNHSAEDDLVIISPHSEAIRFEFTRAFADYYHQSTGRSVHLDWRLPGGTTEIVRYLNSEFEASFRSYWTQQLGSRGIERSWRPLPTQVFMAMPIEARKENVPATPF